MSDEGRIVTGGGDWERFTFVEACNEPLPNSWKNACRRWANHSGPHHTWDPRTGTDRGRHPRPVYDAAGVRSQTVWAWGLGVPFRDGTRMLSRRAYVAPQTTDRLMVELIRLREVPA